MAAILLNKGEQSLINTWLVGASVTGSTGATTGLGLAKVTGGVAAMDKTWVYGTTPATQIAELGVVGANGYARQVINRNNDGSTPKWPSSTLVSSSHQTTGTQVTFTFTGAPNLNDATIWFVALGTVIATSDILFGADLGATRTFANGDTEKVTPTFRAT